MKQLEEIHSLQLSENMIHLLFLVPLKSQYQLWFPVSSVVEPDPVNKLRLWAVTVIPRVSVVAKLQQFLKFLSNFNFFNTNSKKNIYTF